VRGRRVVKHLRAGERCEDIHLERRLQEKWCGQRNENVAECFHAAETPNIIIKLQGVQAVVHA